jgi:O-antigen ligase
MNSLNISPLSSQIARHKVYRFLTSSVWLPLLLAILFGGFLGLLIARDAYHFALPFALVIPVFLLFLIYPYTAVLIWLTVFPYFLHASSVEARYIYWILHRAMVPATLILTTLSNWAGLMKRKPIKYHLVNGAMLSLLFYLVLNILFLTEQKVPNLIHFYDFIFIPLCMYWLVNNLSLQESDLKFLTLSAVITLPAQAAISMISWTNPGLLPIEWQDLAGIRTVGTFDNPAVYTTTLMFAALVIFHTAQYTRKRLQRIALYSLFGGTIFLIFFSFSRDSWLGLTLVLLGLLFHKPRVMMKVLLGVLILGILLGALFFGEELKFAQQRLSNTHTAEDRIIQVFGSLRMFLAKPVLGWGYRNYDLHMKQFKTRVGNIPIQIKSTSHNTFLTILAEQGLIGFVLYMIPLICFGILTLRRWQKISPHSYLGRDWLVTLWLFLLFHFTVNNFVDMIRFHAFGNTTWWLGLGLIANALRSSSISSPERNRSVQARKTGGRNYEVT